jgi:hypothetical protein
VISRPARPTSRDVDLDVPAENDKALMHLFTNSSPDPERKKRKRT